MVTVLDALGLGVILLVNTAAVALLTRFFRVRLHTRWGSAAYATLGSPVVLVVLTLFLSGVLGLGPDLGSVAVVVALVVVLPMATGLTFDYVWMPAPEEVDLPETYDDGRERDRERRERLRP
jgi:Na+/melibiose symporter-like transporter